MGSLVDLTKRARAAGGDVVLFGASPQVLRTMQLLRLDRFLTLREGLEATLAGLGGSRPAQSPPRMAKGWTVLTMPQRLDLASAREVRSEGEQALAERPYLVTDFRITEYLDSSGIAAILALWRRAKSEGGELRLAGLRKEVQRTLELAGVAALLTVHGDIESATADIA